MFISRKKQYGKTYLAIMDSYRVDGKNKHKTIKSLGYLEDLKEEVDDIDSYLEKALKEAKSDYYKNLDNDSITIKISQDDVRAKKNLGYAIVKKIYSKLEIRKFLNNRSRHMDLNYSLNQVFLLLVLNRFIDPWSKRRAYHYKDLFFEKFDFSEQQMYQSLSILSDLSEKMQGFLYEQTKKLVEIDKEVCKYDVTNFFFYSDKPDENTLSEDGRVEEYGIKRMGPSKEHVNRPITQYGLLCDKNGIPLFYDIFSGGQSEKTSFIPIINNSQEALKIPKIIVIADRGINTPTNMYGLSGDNGAYTGDRRSKDDNIYRTKRKDGFIFGQTIRGQGNDLINWVLDPEGYDEKKIDGETYKFKSRITVRTVKVNTKEGKKSQRKIRIKELAYYNSIYDRRTKHEREDLIESGEKLKDDVGKYNQKSKRGNGRYVQNNHYAIVDGKKVKATEQELEVDYLKAETDALLDGYYCLVTSELEMPDEEVWANYHELHDIERCFRVSKSELKIRPVFVWTRSSINAHVLICFVALLIFRILQSISGFKYSSDQIFDAIHEYSLTYAADGYYLCDKQKTDIIKRIGEKLGLKYKKHYISEFEIRKMLKY